MENQELTTEQLQEIIKGKDQLIGEMFCRLRATEAAYKKLVDAVKKSAKENKEQE